MPRHTWHQVVHPEDCSLSSRAWHAIKTVDQSTQGWSARESLTPKLSVVSEVTQLCLTLCDPMDCSLPGSSIHGIFQARILEWVAISVSRRSPRHRD